MNRSAGAWTAARPVYTSLFTFSRWEAPPSSVVKCLWEVFVWRFGVLLFLSCVLVSVSGVLFSVGVYVCVTC